MARRRSHPILQVAMGVLSQGERERYIIDAAGRVELQRAMARYSGAPDLEHAVRELVQFAWFLDVKQACRTAARVLLDVAEAAVAALGRSRPSLRRMIDRLHRSARRYTAFRGERPALQAPGIDDRAPQGSVKLALLKPVLVR